MLPLAPPLLQPIFMEVSKGWALHEDLPRQRDTGTSNSGVGAGGLEPGSVLPAPSVCVVWGVIPNFLEGGLGDV